LRSFVVRIIKNSGVLAHPAAALFTHQLSHHHGWRRR
jgi:hypothetical protein